MKKKILIGLLVLFLLATSIFFFYCNNTRLADPAVRKFYSSLKAALKQRGLNSRLLVISTKRVKWHNEIQVKWAGAATKSWHLEGLAIDFIVFDINKDGDSDVKDVDIVYKILDESIIKNNGGIGTYKKERSFLNRQMIHIDNRGYRARWHH